MAFLLLQKVKKNIFYYQGRGNEKQLLVSAIPLIPPFNYFIF